MSGYKSQQKNFDARGIQIDDKADRIGLRFPVEIGRVGDAKPTVSALLPLVEIKEDRKFLETAQAEMKDWWELMETRAMRDETPIKPQRVAHELSKLAADNAIISGDSGTNVSWVARHFKIRGSQSFSCSGTLTTMAPGLPYLIAAAVAFPANRRNCQRDKSLSSGKSGKSAPRAARFAGTFRDDCSGGFQ